MNAPPDHPVPLARHLLLRSSDAEEVNALYERKRLSFEALDVGLDVTINAAYLPSVHVSYLAYGAAARVWMGAERDEHWIALPLRGGLEATAHGQAHSCAPGGDALIASPGQDLEFRSQAGGLRFGLAILHDALVRQLSALLGAPTSGDLVFEPVLQGGRRGGRVVAEHLRLAVRELDAGDSLLRNRLRRRSSSSPS